MLLLLLAIPVTYYLMTRQARKYPDSHLAKLSPQWRVTVCTAGVIGAMLGTSLYKRAPADVDLDAMIQRLKDQEYCRVSARTSGLPIAGCYNP